MAAEARSKNVVNPELSGADAPALIFGKVYPSYWYIDVLVKYPTIFCALYGFVPFLLAVLSLTFVPTLDVSDDTMSIRDHWSAQNAKAIDTVRDNWLNTVQSYKINQRSTVGVGVATRSNIARRLYITYELDPEKLVSQGFTLDEETRLSNLYEPENIAHVHRIEAPLHRSPDYGRVCWRAPFRGAQGDEALVDYILPTCSPMSSVLSYFYPGSMQNRSGLHYWEFTGHTGDLQRPLDSMAELMYQNPFIAWYTDQLSSADNPRTSLLRTQINLGTPVITNGQASDDAEEADLLDRFTDVFIDWMDGSRPDHGYINVGFGGDQVAERLIVRAINSDANLIIPSVFLMLGVLWWHFHSLLLSAIATCQIASTFPAGYVVYMAVHGEDLSLLSSLNVFVVLVIAANSMMIMFDTFKQSGYMATTGRRNMLSVAQRMAYTFRKAGVGVTVANLVAAACFGIATTSKVPAVSNFAVLVTCLICVNWFLMISFFPAAILFHHFHISGRRRNLQRQKEILLEKGLRRRDQNVVLFMKEETELRERLNLPTFAAVHAEMKAEGNHEGALRQGQSGIWGSLGIQNPIQMRNPFGATMNRQPSMVVDGDGGPEDDANAGVNAQDLLDQFQDASPREGGEAATGNRTVTVGGAAANSIQFDHRNANLQATFRVSNINSDELLGFDDAPVRFKLMEMGAQAPADFTDAQLEEVAPLLGIQPQGNAASRRLSNIARQSIFLMYGSGRSVIQRPADDGAAAATPSAAATAAVASGTAAAAAGMSTDVDGPGSPPGRQQQQAGQQQQQQPPGQDGQQQQQPPKNKRFGFSKKISNWWQERKSVQRRWCCGMVGQRVDETPEEREARIMSKKTKHEGYSRAELLFFNYWAPFVNYTRFALLALLVVWIVIAIVFTVQLKPRATKPDLIGDSPVDRYQNSVSRFGQTGTCDLCSAFFQPVMSFPRPFPFIVDVCSRESDIPGNMINAELDQCGVCYGNNSCIDCRGINSGPHRVDSCGQCLLPTDFRWDACNNCSVIGNLDSPMECGACPVRANTGVGFAGAACAVQCSDDTCNPKGGRCNAVTGTCDCFQDYTRGYWQNSGASSLSCDQCDPLFSGENCTIECTDASTSPCNCNVNIGQCTGCISTVYGASCSALNPATCHPTRGFLSSFGCGCVDSQWDTRSGCNYESQCNGRGLFFNAADLPTGESPGCKCLGQWRGPNCQYCKCHNGGTCTQNGTCICSGGFSGVDCQQCPDTCSLHGSCPQPTPPELYPTGNCRGVFCTDTELAAANATSTLCQRCEYSGNSTVCGTYNNSEVQCEAINRCQWDRFSQTCRRRFWSDFDAVSVPLPTNYTECTCRGSWAGQFCERCSNALFPGTKCDERTGELLGCDGNGPNSRGQYKVVDQCGTCGGSTTCAGCDGIPGSTKTLDLCGVCGGFNECAAGAAANGGQIVSSTSEIRIMFGKNTDGSQNAEFNFEDPGLQSHLHWVCIELKQRQDLTRTAQTRCIMLDFVEYLRSSRGIPFPLPGWAQENVHRYMFEFVSSTGRWDEVGFRSLDPLSTQQQVLFIIFYVRAAGVFDDTPENKQNDALDLWGRIMRNVNKPDTRGAQGEAFMASQAWINTFTQRASRDGTIFIAVVASMVFLMVQLTLTCSPTLMCISGLVLTSHILSLLGIYRMLGWELGPVEMIAMALLLGLTSEQMMHMSEAYLEFLHASQSHMFARDTTRLQAVKGMYQRTGVSSLTSCLTILFSSLFLFLAKLLILRRVAAVILILMLTNIVHALVFAGGLLCLVGPTVTYRNRRTMGAWAMIAACIFSGLFIILWFAGAIRII